jgi:putative ABC transport system permease protein
MTRTSQSEASRAQRGSLYFTYLRLELRHRLRQAIFIAAGLAVGIALVITVTAVAAGTSNAQAGVLNKLYGIGTDITVTRPYSPSAADAAKEDHEINPGMTGFEYLDDANQGMFSAPTAASIAALPGVRAAAGMLALTQSTPSTYHGSSNPLVNPGLGAPVATLLDAVDTADRQLGPLSEVKIISGRDLTAADADADVAIVDSGYAKANRLHVGSVITLAHHDVRVVGIFSSPDVQIQNAANPEYIQPTGTVPDILIPLGAGQALADLPGEITTVYVAAASTADIGAVAAKIKAQLPWADVTTSASLASEISGSLGTTAKLAKDLGRWLAIAVLAAAFALAALLMVMAVSRRVREFGTLKALGWSARRITGQVLGESVTLGVAGALAGIGLGYAATALISALESTLTATAAAAPGTTEPHGFFAGADARTGQFFHRTTLFPGTYSSTPVHFSAPVAPGVVALAAALGIAGGLLAGALASWRAARLRPTVALAHAG